MQFYIKNKFITLGGNSYAEDEQKNKFFKIKGKIISPTRKKKIYDMNGNLCYIVRNKFWRLLKTSTFIFDSNKNLVGMLSNGDFDFKRKFVLTDARDDIVISGNLIQFPNIKHEITKNGQLIGTITKEFNMLRDTYRVDVNEEQDAALLCALVISIDNIYDSKSKR